MPAKNLKAGDIGTVVLVHEEGKGYTVEFMNRKLLSDIRGRAEQGDAQSQSELGSAFRPGNLGVAKDAVEAVKGAGVHAFGCSLLIRGMDESVARREHSRVRWPAIDLRLMAGSLSAMATGSMNEKWFAHIRTEASAWDSIVAHSKEWWTDADGFNRSVDRNES